MSKNKKLAKKIFIYLLAGSSVLYSIPMAYAATSVIANNTLPSGFQPVVGGAEMTQSGNIMDITQSVQNAVNKWQSFDVGGSATVNFTGPQSFNSLNYVNGGNLSQIYGTINANGGNIFLVNPAGVQIGNSAQINVGSLYVSNKKFEDESVLEAINKDGTIKDITDTINDKGTFGNGDLMSLGNIKATNVTFEGNGRIVIDADRIRNAEGTAVNDNFSVHTTDADNVVIGYEAYDGTYAGKGQTFGKVYENNAETSVDGYMWVEDVEQLQAMNTNLSGNYALRNSIDATESSNFAAVGDTTTAFSGKLDGLDNNIFSLTVNGTANVGLFGRTDSAQIRNVTLIGGNITGTNNVGALVGSANNTVIENVKSTASVTGTGTNTGGIVGAAQNSTKLDSVINTGTITGVDNVGGLSGSLTNSQITGTSYNLGAVTGSGHDVGGLVGNADNATIGDGTNLVYNRLDVTGAYNVGGIVGSMSQTKLTNAENKGTITSTGSTAENYIYYTSITDSQNLPAGSSFVNGWNNSDGAQVLVNVSNVGGIAGNTSNDSTLANVLNSGNVSSTLDTSATEEFYTAGNVGGVVGKAADTTITSATNYENTITGAHNVGGVVGSLSGNSLVTAAMNNGGDVTATGARRSGITDFNNGFAQEQIRIAQGSENFNIGNIGGIVGYLDGDDGARIADSGNRGNVHSMYYEGNVNITAAAANVGGIVGKINKKATTTADDMNEIRTD